MFKLNKKNNILKITSICFEAIFVFVLIFLFEFSLVNADNTYIFNKNIKNNVTSQDVKELQKYLNNNGYIISESGAGSLGKETNFFGFKTKKAVIFFQKENNLIPDGIVGPLTRDTINKKHQIIKNIDDKYFISGSVSGLLGSISLKNNGGDKIIMNLGDKNDFTFPTKIVNGGDYLVTVNSLYLGQKCNVYYESGIVNNSDISNIQVVCIPYKLISGMSGHRDRVITIKDITGVTVPVTGAIPTTSVTETSEYTGVVTWSPISSTFVVDTIYTATITVEPKRGYKLEGIPENFFIINGATSINNINSGIITTIFPVTVPVIQLTISDPVLTISKPYDENNLAVVTPGTLSGIVGVDDVSVTSIANYDSSLVGVGKTITVVYTLSGLDSVNYIKPINYTVTTGEITAVKLSSPSLTPIAGKIPLTLALVGDVSSTGTSIEIETNNVGSNIYYTLDGSSPTTSSTKYSSPIVLNQDTTLKTLEVKDQYIDSDIISSEYKINQSPFNTFTDPHGTVLVGDKLYIGTRTSPATVTVFTNPNDLTIFQTIILTGHSNLDNLIYDSVNDKLYASCYDDDKKVTIISIDPNNLSDWSLVYKNLYNEWSAPIVTDGIYIYGVTFNNIAPSIFFKISISDWVLFASLTWNDNLGVAPWADTYYPHAVSLVNYADRKEMYVTTVYDTPTRFAKVNLNGTMSYTSISLGGNYSITDDITCRYMDETGSLCYAGTDFNYPGYSSEKTGFKIDSRNMTFTKFSIGGSSSYGMFIKGNDLYNLGLNNTIVRYRDFDTSLPEIFSTSSIVPNEFLYSSSGKIYISDWQNSNPSKLVEILFKN